VGITYSVSCTSGERGVGNDPQVIDLESGAVVGRGPPHPGSVQAVLAFEPADSREAHCLSVGYWGVLLWNAETRGAVWQRRTLGGRAWDRIPGGWACLFETAEGRYCIAVSAGTQVALYDLGEAPTRIVMRAVGKR
jgi:hypothetical protein